MGRHTSSDAAGAGSRVTWLAVVGAVVAAALIWFGVSRGLGTEGDETLDASPTTSGAAEDFAAAMDGHGEHTEEPEAAAQTQTAEPAEQVTVTEEAEAATETEDATEDATEGVAAVPEAVVACVDEVTAAEGVAEAASISARNWRTHFTQQLLIDEGEITFEQAQGPWAETKAEGPKDQERFAAAESGYEDAAGACAEVDVDQEELAAAEVDPDALASCTERSEALATVATRGAQVNQDWADHLEQMKAKAETDPEEYYAWWIEVVEAAPESMESYDEAVDTLEDAPACEVTTR